MLRERCIYFTATVKLFGPEVLCEARCTLTTSVVPMFEARPGIESGPAVYEIHKLTGSGFFY